MKKLSLILTALLISSASFAQFMNAVSGSASSSSSSDNTPWKGLRFSYDRTNAKVDYEGADDYDFNGFSIGYVHAFSIAKQVPLFIETGAGINFAKYSDSWDESESNEYGTITYEEKASITSLGLTIPVNLVYKLSLNDKWSISPYTGFYLRANLMAKESWKGELSASGEYADYIDDYRDEYEYDEDYNLFDEDEVGKDATLNRVNFGWQIGATFGYKKFNFGIGYALDLNEIAEKTKCGIFSARLGVNF